MSHHHQDDKQKDTKTLPSIDRKQKQQLKQVNIVVHDHDVLFGSRSFSSNHPGNKLFNELIDSRLDSHYHADEGNKLKIIQEIITSIRALKPSGRFLQKKEDQGWEELDDYTSIRIKCASSLRDRQQLRAYRERRLRRRLRRRQERRQEQLQLLPRLRQTFPTYNQQQQQWLEQYGKQQQPWPKQKQQAQLQKKQQHGDHQQFSSDIDADYIQDYEKFIIDQHKIVGRYHPGTRSLYIRLGSLYAKKTDNKNAIVAYHTCCKVSIYLDQDGHYDQEIDRNYELLEESLTKIGLTQHQIEQYKLNLTRAARLEKEGDLYRSSTTTNTRTENVDHDHKIKTEEKEVATTTTSNITITIPALKKSIERYKQVIELEKDMIGNIISISYLYRKVSYLLFLSSILQTIQNKEMDFSSSAANTITATATANISKDRSAVVIMGDSINSILDWKTVDSINIERGKQILNMLNCKTLKDEETKGTGAMDRNDNNDNRNMGSKEQQKAYDLFSVIHNGDVSYINCNYEKSIEYYKKVDTIFSSSYDLSKTTIDHTHEDKKRRHSDNISSGSSSNTSSSNSMVKPFKKLKTISDPNICHDTDATSNDNQNETIDDRDTIISNDVNEYFGDVVFIEKNGQDNLDLRKNLIVNGYVKWNSDQNEEELTHSTPKPSTNEVSTNNGTSSTSPSFAQSTGGKDCGGRAEGDQDDGGDDGKKMGGSSNDPNSNGNNDGNMIDIYIEQEPDNSDGITIEPKKKLKYRKKLRFEQIDLAKTKTIRLKKMIEQFSVNIFGKKVDVKNQCLLLDDDTILDDGISLEENGVVQGSTLYVDDATDKEEEPTVKMAMSYNSHPGCERVQCALDVKVKQPDGIPSYQNKKNKKKQDLDFGNIKMNLFFKLQYLSDGPSNTLKVSVRKVSIMVEKEENMPNIWDMFLQKIKVKVNIGRGKKNEIRGDKDWYHCGTNCTLNKGKISCNIQTKNKKERGGEAGIDAGFNGIGINAKARESNFNEEIVQREDNTRHINYTAWDDSTGDSSWILTRAFWNKTASDKYVQYENKPQTKRRWWNKMLRNNIGQLYEIPKDVLQGGADKELDLLDEESGVVSMAFIQPDGGVDEIIESMLDFTVTIRMELVTIFAEQGLFSSSQPNYGIFPNVRTIKTSGNYNLKDIQYLVGQMKEQKTEEGSLLSIEMLTNIFLWFTISKSRDN